MSFGKVNGNQWVASTRVYERREYKDNRWINTGEYSETPFDQCRLVVAAGTSMPIVRAEALGLYVKPKKKAVRKTANKAVTKKEDK